MTTTTAWAVVDRDGTIISIYLDELCSKDVEDEFTRSLGVSQFPSSFKCIPVTIKPKEDGE